MSSNQKRERKPSRQAQAIQSMLATKKVEKPKVEKPVTATTIVTPKSQAKVMESIVEVIKIQRPKNHFRISKLEETSGLIARICVESKLLDPGLAETVSTPKVFSDREQLVLKTFQHVEDWEFVAERWLKKMETR